MQLLWVRPCRLFDGAQWSSWIGLPRTLNHDIDHTSFLTVLMADLIPCLFTKFVWCLRCPMARLQSSTFRLRMERSRLGHWRTMYLCHASLDLPHYRQHPEPNARFFRSHFSSNDLFLHLLVNLYPSLDTLHPTMAYPDQDQIGRLLPFLCRYAGTSFDCVRWSWRYFDQKGISDGE